MKGGLGQLMKQAQKMQEEMQKAQQELSNKEVVGRAGGGMVGVLMNGRHDVKRVTIEETAMEDKDMLEDLIAAAVNDAVRQIEEHSKNNMGDMAEGLNLPPGFKLPF